MWILVAEGIDRASFVRVLVSRQSASRLTTIIIPYTLSISCRQKQRFNLYSNLYKAKILHIPPFNTRNINQKQLEDEE